MSNGAAKRVADRPENIHEFDWDIDYRRTGQDTFEIDIKSCGFIAYAKKYGGIHMLPGICRVDYMISHYIDGQHGVRDVALSVPSVIGAAGEQMRIREKWKTDEYRKFFDAVENVRNVLQQL
jgi:malate/lactate dehydrogenase